MNPEFVTAKQYMDLERMAIHELPARFELKQLQADLMNMPMTRERLVFEFLAYAEEALENGMNPQDPALLAIRMSTSVRPENIPCLIASLERISLQCFELIGIRRDSHCALALVGALSSLRLLDGARFTTTIKRLEQACMSSEFDARSELLGLVQLAEADRKQALHRLLREVLTRSVEVARSAIN